MTNRTEIIGPKAIIHLDHLKHNARVLQEKAGNVPLMGVVKANAYGHGVIPVTRALQSIGIDQFAVFTFEEALALREAGITDPVLIFSRMRPEILDAAVEQNITLNMSWIDDFDAILKYHQTHGKSPAMHLKLDTGMTRLGMPLEDAKTVLNRLLDHPEIRCEGVYSHYATADEGDKSYAEYQLSIFNEFMDYADERGYEFKWVHFSNSGAILNVPESYFNLLRVGMLLYGAYPSDEVPRDLYLKPVMEFAGPIVNLRRVPKGTQVSYGGKYTTEKDTHIGVIQTGFADGFPRPWYEEGYVGYKGKRYKIAGRCCMDQFMVDFGDDEPTLWDKVLIFGENSTDRITVDTISDTIGFTTYMLLTAIGGRTEWVFVENE